MGMKTPEGKPTDGISYCLNNVMQHQPRTVFVKVRTTELN